MRRVVRRRTLLRGAALVPLAGVVAGCGDLARTAGLGEYVRVAVPWSAAELAAFSRVLDRRGTRDYELIPLGDDIGAALGARAGGRPDLVALPQPGKLSGNIESLAKLTDVVWHPRYDEIWPPATVDGAHYALPFKLAHASVVWYRKRFFAEHGLTPPTTLAEWLALNEAVIDIGGPAPLALGGADGWFLAQFFENVLLRSFTETFRELARPHDARLWDSAPVRSAFEMVADMWGRARVLSGGANRALVQQFPDAVLEVFRYGRAVMVPAPDFAESVIRRFAGLDDVATFTFPTGDGGAAPLAISADLLVLNLDASPDAAGLIRYLATPDAPVPWIRDTGGFIAANPLTDTKHYTPTLLRLVKELEDSEIEFGLADRLGRLGGSEGLQRVLQNLLRGIAAGVTPSAAARTACAAMVDAKRRTG